MLTSKASLEHFPESVVRIRHVYGVCLHSLGRCDDAAQQYKIALASQEKSREASDIDEMECRRDYALCLDELERYDDVAKQYEIMFSSEA